MAVLEIVKFPSAILKQKSKPVGKVDAKIRRLAADMIETMYEARGIGLAAIQVGVPLRMIVIDVGQLDEEPNPRIFINPEIVEGEGTVKHDEGCLSVPGYNAPVERYEQVLVRYQTIDGELFEEKADELLARAFQHEIDHLEGVLFVDHLGKIRREMFLRKYRKQLENAL